MDHKKSINVAMQSILDSMQSGKKEIFAITEDIEKENRRVKSDISEIKKIISKYTQEIDEIKQRELQSRIRLLEVSSNFTDYTDTDIKLAYEVSELLQKDLTDKQNEINNILQNLDNFESRIKRNNDLVIKADELLNRLEIMSEYMKLDAKADDDSSDIFSRWMAFQEKEKSRIARDIHDGPAQTMASLVIKSDIIKKLIEKETPTQTIYKELEQLKVQLRAVIQDIRKIMYDLRPTSLDELGFIPSVEGLLKKMQTENNIDFTFVHKEKDFIKSENIKIVCFRVVQESLNNIVKHSKANKTSVIIAIQKNAISIEIEDNGIGFDTSYIDTSKSFGLSSLRERISLVNGYFNIVSKENKGTKIKVTVPNKEEKYV